MRKSNQVEVVTKGIEQNRTTPFREILKKNENI